MIKQNLIIYKFKSLYHILEELGLDLNFKIIFADTKDSLEDKLINHNNSLIITNSKYVDIGEESITDVSEYNSDNTERLDVEGMKLLLNKLKFIKAASKGEIIDPEE